MPPPVRPPHPGNRSALSSTSTHSPLPSVATATHRVQWEMGHWFDSHLLQPERDMVGTDQTATAPETEGGQRDQRGEEMGPMRLEEGRR